MLANKCEVKMIQLPLVLFNIFDRAILRFSRSGGFLFYSYLKTGLLTKNLIFSVNFRVVF